MPKSLPDQPSLEHLKAQARDLRTGFLAGDATSQHRVGAFFPAVAALKLSQAQLVVAREYGFSSWATLKARVAPKPIPDSTPLSRAVMAQDLERAKKLLDAGAEPGDNDSLYHAMESDTPDLMLLLLARGARLETETNALAHLLDGEKPDWLEAALKFVENPKALPPVLSHALRRGRSAEIFQILLDAGVDPSAPDDGDRTPYQSATRLGRADVAKLLEKAGADTSLTPTDALLGKLARSEAVKRSEITPEIISILDAEPTPVLLLLAERGRNAALRTLLEAGANPNVRDSQCVPLHQAALHGRLETVRILLDHGADPSLVDTVHGGDALGWASFGAEHTRAAPSEDYAAIIELLKPVLVESLRPA